MLVPVAPAADKKHKQPMNRHERGRFVAFAYTSRGKTAEGKLPVAGKTIAADPAVLPLGSRVRISGAGPWSGEYRVGDVGANIKGRKVDIFVSGKSEAVVFGRREVTIAVIELPARAAQCTRCKSTRRDIINTDEAWGTNSASSSETGGTGIDPGQDDSGESGGTAALAGLSAFAGTSVN